MKTIGTTWRIFSLYMLIIIAVVIMSATPVNAQIKVIQFNAEWNKANGVDWIQSLTDCNTIAYVDVGKDKEAQTKYKIAVLPTVIIFKDNEEVARFQADLSFKMVATKEEVQEEIDNILMSDF